MAQKVDATDWDSLVDLFETAMAAHGRVDIVFANAGTQSYTTHQLQADLTPTRHKLASKIPNPRHDPHRPAPRTLHRNPRPQPARLHQHRRARDALHGQTHRYASCPTPSLPTPSPDPPDPPAPTSSSSGSIIITASAASYIPFGSVDYTVTKHALVGFVRAMQPNLRLRAAERPGARGVRVNALAPLWTDTGISSATPALLASVGAETQGAGSVALVAGVLVSDFFLFFGCA